MQVIRLTMKLSTSFQYSLFRKKLTIQFVFTIITFALIRIILSHIGKNSNLSSASLKQSSSDSNSQIICNVSLVDDVFNKEYNSWHFFTLTLVMNIAFRTGTCK